jgi:phenylacetate-CoA ligase
MKRFIQNYLYAKLPIFVQNILISVFGFVWRKRRFGGVFEKELKLARSREQFSVDEWIKFQESQLIKLLIHSYDTVPYYRERFEELEIHRDYLNKISLKDLVSLPILEKEHLRAFGRTKLMSTALDKNGEYFSSSGSTGTPTSIYFSVRMHQIWSAIFEARIRIWAGLTNRTPRGMIGGRRVVTGGNSMGPFYRYNYAEKQTYFSAYHINSTNVSDYIQGIEKNGVQYMTGYAMSNFFLAKFIEESGLKAPQLKAVVTSSEKLTEEMRATFNRVYGCKTYDSYSGVEACGLISECEYGKLHISPDAGILEVIKSNGEYAIPGETGELICTGLLNFDQPLIRYRIGDVVTLAKNQTCSCGRSMTIVEEIIGRFEDTVIGSDGRLMVRFHGIFVGLPNVVEGQIIQEDINMFHVNVVSTTELTEDTKLIIHKRMISQLGDVQIQICQMDSIPRNNNGKFKAVISKIK